MSASLVRKWVHNFKWVGRSLLVVALVSAPLALGRCGGSDASADSATVAIAANGRSPQDSALDSAAAQVYFIGSDARGPGVYRVASTGGAVTDVLVGAPLVQPQSLVVSSDDKTIFVADAQGGGGGAIFAIAGSSGAVTRTLASGTHPRGIDVISQGGADQIFFTGSDSTSGMPGLFRVSADGSGLSTVAKGSPFRDPSGVVATRAGDAYVTDTPGASGQGRIIHVAGGSASELMSNLWLGKPAGISITSDESTLVVSALNPASATDQVLLINLASRGVTTFTKDIGQNSAAGGVHRSRNSDTFSWADLRGSVGSGTVYTITFK